MASQPVPQSHVVEMTRPESRILVSHFTGNGTGNPTFDTAQAAHGPILSITRTGTGTYAVVFREFYPALTAAPSFAFVGTLPFTGRCSAIAYGTDPATDPPTATFVFSVGAFETDLPTTTQVFATWIVRNSARNP